MKLMRRRRAAPSQCSGGASAPSPLEQRRAIAFGAVDQRAGVIEDWIREQLRGRCVGDSIKTPGSTTFIIDAIHEVKAAAP
jgi:hypothetical protein